MNNKDLALDYLPIVHYDVAETIPLHYVGYTVFEQDGASPSFDRYITVPENCSCVIEYPYFWDYDIQHMYDLEHMWVYVGKDGSVVKAEGSFHGGYSNLYYPGMPYGAEVEGHHVHAYCQPGKHAFLPHGEMFSILTNWSTACNVDCGGRVLVGGPFYGRWFPTPDEDRRSREWIRANYAFQPTLRYTPIPTNADQVIPWDTLYTEVPKIVKAECARLKALEEAK